ncbi:hypothetical protein [Deinococcus cellulosilyticus]|uniref:Uncharacterized protein n=1 Tax=Deinococcus cellulosilyticus (strain DSM 18568 / NBRC 106333 / KACC 11606 / 5516J-15) TaxID=1223518 RepID=A0A511N9W9_DEIC1|nr:hypothetical protein [Deinococcus cellulosilyticus]GEM49623.1 hypothetical protein DC3_52580 [Deinococcus cellulosilyticus NBRC 106333 = KACC 11606]
MRVEAFGMPLRVMFHDLRDYLEVVTDFASASALVDAHDIAEPIRIGDHTCTIEYLQVLGVYPSTDLHLLRLLLEPTGD